MHPGIKGDRGPSSLDWAIANDEKSWGVSILEAAPEFDAGPIWASHEFPLEADPPAKSSLYRGQVTEAAVRGVLEAVARIETGEFKSGSWQPEKLSDALSYARGRLRPPMKQADRAIDWTRDNDGDDRQEGPRGGQRARRPRLAARNKLLPLWRASRGPHQGAAGPDFGPTRRRDLHRHGRWRCLDFPSEGQGRSQRARGGLPPRPGGHRLRALRYGVLLGRRDQIARDAGAGTFASRRARDAAADRRARPIIAPSARSSIRRRARLAIFRSIFTTGR